MYLLLTSPTNRLVMHKTPTRKRHLEKAFGTVQNHWRNNKECVLMCWRGYTGSWREDKKGDKRAADCIGRS
ncbi:unnamed protein product [Brassica rapa subsp. trilocularis]|uniref:(rape) hypothetical protein n=1 Tax=Brassica napus TaxID=3708 RepID=A0A816SPJ3_BRANA|nr:unnamed protein product [Brassica napus]